MTPDYAARVQAHARQLSEDVNGRRVDRIRNRLAYLVANAEALIEEIDSEAAMAAFSMTEESQ